MAGDTPSAAGLQTDSAHADDIIRVASYNRRDFGRAVIKLDPRDHETVRISMIHPFSRTPRSMLGRLDTLPLEILHEVLNFTTIDSLFSFRQVNLRARQIVSTLRRYQPLMLYALEAFCVILRTTLSPWYNLPDLFDVFCARNCLGCGSFAGFVFLPTLTRCCFQCLSTAHQFRVLSMSEAAKRFDLSPGRLRRSVPFMKTIQGVYSMGEIVRKRRMYIAAEQQIAQLFAFSGAKESNESRDATYQETTILRFMASTALAHFDVVSGDIQHGICCAGCQIALEGDVNSSELADACARRDRVYSRIEFIDHFHQCREAQVLWNASKQGTIHAEIPQSVKRGGYFNEDLFRI